MGGELVSALFAAWECCDWGAGVGGGWGSWGVVGGLGVWVAHTRPGIVPINAAISVA